MKSGIAPLAFALPTRLSASRRHIGDPVRRKTLLAALLAVVTIVALALPAAANVVPNNPRVGQKALTRMQCFVGTVTFTITGNGVSIPVGSAVAGSDGWAQLELTVPDIKPGQYTMVGSGTDCDGKPKQVNVGFVVRGRDDDDPGEYPPRGCSVGIDRGRAEPGERARVRGRCFRGEVRFVLGNRELGRVQADKDGNAELEFTVPELDDGDYVLSAFGTDENGSPMVLATSLAMQRTAVVPPSTSTTTSVPPSKGEDAPVVTAPKSTVPTQVLGATENAPASPAVATPAPAKARGGVLAFSGSDTASLVQLGLLALAVGSLLAFGTRRRAPKRG